MQSNTFLIWSACTARCLTSMLAYTGRLQYLCCGTEPIYTVVLHKANTHSLSIYYLSFNLRCFRYNNWEICPLKIHKLTINKQIKMYFLETKPGRQSTPSTSKNDHPSLCTRPSLLKQDVSRVKGQLFVRWENITPGYRMESLVSLVSGWL